jgi:hypothetical protein
MEDPDKYVCGTAAGYRRHKQWNEPVCDRCRVAYNEEAVYYQTTARRARRRVARMYPALFKSYYQQAKTQGHGPQRAHEIALKRVGEAYPELCKSYLAQEREEP